MAVPHAIGRHAHPAARPEPGVEPPPPATGIDYLRLVEARADAELGQRTSYAGMAEADSQLVLPGADWGPAGPARLTVPPEGADEETGGEEVAR